MISIGYGFSLHKISYQTLISLPAWNSGDSYQAGACGHPAWWGGLAHLGRSINVDVDPFWGACNFFRMEAHRCADIPGALIAKGDLGNRQNRETVGTVLKGMHWVE